MNEEVITSVSDYGQIGGGGIKIEETLVLHNHPPLYCLLTCPFFPLSPLSSLFLPFFFQLSLDLGTLSPKTIKFHVMT